MAASWIIVLASARNVWGTPQLLMPAWEPELGHCDGMCGRQLSCPDGEQTGILSRHAVRVPFPRGCLQPDVLCRGTHLQTLPPFCALQSLQPAASAGPRSAERIQRHVDFRRKTRAPDRAVPGLNRAAGDRLTNLAAGIALAVTAAGADFPKSLEFRPQSIRARSKSVRRTLLRSPRHQCSAARRHSPPVTRGHTAG